MDESPKPTKVSEPSAAYAAEAAVPPDVLSQVENRAWCGWFVRDDFVPQTRADTVFCLDNFCKHGDFALWKTAKKLKQCLKGVWPEIVV